MYTITLSNGKKLENLEPGHRLQPGGLRSGVGKSCVREGKMQEILVAIITGGLALVGVIITNVAGNRRAEEKLRIAQAVTDAKIDELTREVRKHNGFAEKMPVIQEQIKVINHRIADLENERKDHP